MSALFFLKISTSFNIWDIFESSLGRILPLFFIAIVIYFVITFFINKNKKQ